MKVFFKCKTFLGKKLDDQAETREKYYLAMTFFTCGGENFLEVDGRSFEPIEVPESYCSGGFFKISSAI